MRLDGWSRLVLVISLAWIVGVGAVAYVEYPRSLNDRSAFWAVYKNPLDAFDDPPTPYKATGKGLFDDLIPPGRVDANREAFALYGAVPVVLLWALYGAFVWVRRGFNQARA